MNPCRILIVDDEKMILDLLEFGLRRLVPECSVVTAVNGRQALEKMQAEKFSLVITDIEMPVLDGLALLSEIQKICPEIPAMAISGRWSAEDRQRAQEAGAFKCLEKPFSMDVFADALGPVLAGNEVSKGMDA